MISPFRIPETTTQGKLVIKEFKKTLLNRLLKNNNFKIFMLFNLSSI